MKMTNRWNTIIYRLWAPVYDQTVNHLFMPGRRRAIEVLALQPGERVLLIGIGTGADVPLLPPGVSATGIDLSPAMLAKARQKLPSCRARVNLILGDAQALPLAPGQFDAVILNLILSVAPDGNACMRSALEALEPGGRIVIFDKFLPDQMDLTFSRRFLNLFSTLFGTDITRRFSEVSAGCHCDAVCDEASLMRGTYRVIMIRKRLLSSGRMLSR